MPFHSNNCKFCYIGFQKVGQMYITAFAPISSMALEIEALLFAINWFREET